MKVAVIGSGRGGYALAADLATRGHHVAFNSGDRREDAEAIHGAGGIRLTGILGERRVALEPEPDIAHAVSGADLIAIPVPMSVQERYLALVLPHLATGQAVWLCQGAGGTLVPLARERAADLLMIESMYIPYSARRVGPADIVVRMRLRVPYAAFPARRNAEAARLMDELFELPTATNVLEVALQNVNAILHPLPCLLNWGQIEGRENAFVLTRDGMAPRVIRSMEAIDAERVAVCRAAGLSDRSIDQVYELMGVTPPPYRRPPSGGGEAYEDRYIREAVPFGLVTIASAGRQLGVPTPLCDSTIRLCDELYSADSWSEGRTMRALGIDGLDPAGLEGALW